MPPKVNRNVKRQVMPVKTYIVDSFTDKAFKGNPAGVCLAETPVPEVRMLDIAAELNLSETAFVVPLDGCESFSIRYFSPQTEIPLCGHATLASARVLFEKPGVDTLRFKTVRGVWLEVNKSGDQIAMKFPVYPVRPAKVPEALLDALGLPQVTSVSYNEENNILMLEIASAEKLRALAPDFGRLRQSHNTINGVLVTAPGLEGYDFYSRYFWPWSGTNEDPVTGATHTFMAPFWANKLGKTKLKSFQCSARSGFMEIEIRGSELLIKGRAVTVFEGQLLV